MRRLVPALLVLGAGCTTTPLAPVPDPFPETLAWAVESSAAGGFLGLKVRENDSGSLDELFFEPGVRVTRVVENSPASAAAMRVGDVLLAWDGEAVDDPRSLEELERAAEPGSEARLDVRRGDSVFELTVRLAAAGGAAPADPPELLYRADPSRSRAGWLAGREGVVLVASDPGAPFPRAGVPVGSVVRAIDGERVRSERALLRRLAAREPGERVAIDFQHPDGSERTARVRLARAPTKVTGVSVPVLFTYGAEVDGSETRFVLLDLWIISLFRYRREGAEREWRFLRFFRFSKGVGELAE